MRGGGECLDCGAHEGQKFPLLKETANLDIRNYSGIEWDENSVQAAREKGINVIQGDLNRLLPYDSDRFQCVFALSLLEHLLNPCRFMRESHRVLKTGGQLVLLTPNISTYFTALLILAGKMPSSGPHPDSDMLLKSEEVFKVSSESMISDMEIDTQRHRHLVVFSYRVLKRYLQLIGFTDVKGCGFGLYPFPPVMQPVLEKVDPYHCHQMVFIARK